MTCWKSARARSYILACLNIRPRSYKSRADICVSMPCPPSFAFTVESRDSGAKTRPGRTWDRVQKSNNFWAWKNKWYRPTVRKVHSKGTTVQCQYVMRNKKIFVSHSLDLTDASITA